jgi:hypothetical protein
MATRPDKSNIKADAEEHHSALANHSAFEEFRRDERHPAVLLLSGLVIAATFFGLGIIFDRWTINRQAPSSPASPEQTQTLLQPSNTSSPAHAQGIDANAAAASGSPTNGNEQARVYSILIASFERREEAEAMVRDLERAGYSDAHIPRRERGEREVVVLFGRFPREEAEQIAERMRATGNSVFRNVRVVEDAR